MILSKVLAIRNFPKEKTKCLLIAWVRIRDFFGQEQAMARVRIGRIRRWVGKGFQDAKPRVGGKRHRSLMRFEVSLRKFPSLLHVWFYREHTLNGAAVGGFGGSLDHETSVFRLEAPVRALASNSATKLYVLTQQQAERRCLSSLCPGPPTDEAINERSCSHCRMI